jgi:hypothetical protein
MTYTLFYCTEWSSIQESKTFRPFCVAVTSSDSVMSDLPVCPTSLMMEAVSTSETSVNIY